VNDQYDDPYDRTPAAIMAPPSPAPTLEDVLRTAGQAWETTNAPFPVKLDPLTGRKRRLRNVLRASVRRCNLRDGMTSRALL
jgi:hypothetical protein